MNLVQIYAGEMSLAFPMFCCPTNLFLPGIFEYFEIEFCDLKNN